MINLKQLRDCENLTKEELLNQIQLREALIRQMVGSLYPEILRSEINHLSKLIDEKEAYSDYQ